MTTGGGGCQLSENDSQADEQAWWVLRGRVLRSSVALVSVGLLCHFDGVMLGTRNRTARSAFNFVRKPGLSEDEDQRDALTSNRPSFITNTRCARFNSAARWAMMTLVIGMDAIISAMTSSV